MILDLKRVRIYIRPGSTDLRKAVQGLAVLVEVEMKGAPLSGNVYLFCNRERRLIKALWWERNGFWLSQKRLEKDKYPWPENSEAAMELEREELEMLLRGIDFFKAHKELYYEKVS
jgi:transposase